MKKLVLAYINKQHMIEEGDRVVVGLSGGADSVCLLYILRELQEELNISLEAVHIHHGLRPEADAEAEFVENMCADWNISCRIETADVKGFQEEKGLGTEEAARLLRYDIFEKDIKKGAKIALAHHKNDQAETVLFHLFRGSNLRGLGGIKPVRGQIIRPLLCVTRQEIENYLNEKKISYVTDQSNFDTAYARNLIRHEILPLAEKSLSGSAVEHICTGADSIRLAFDCLDETVRKVYEENVISNEEGCNIEKGALYMLHPYIRDEILYRMLVEACGKQKNISRVHVDALSELADAQSGKERKLIYHMVAFTDQHRLFVQKEDVFLRRRRQSDEANLTVLTADLKPYKENGGKKKVSFGKYCITFRIFPYNKEDIPCGNYTKWFDYDKIETGSANGEICVRYRQSGDFFHCTKNFSKKVQDYMVDQKIPSAERDRIPVIADGSHIMWIVGYRISEFYKITDETKYILEIAAEKGE